MKPVLFKLGSININGYGLMIAIGILAGIWLLTYRSKKRGYNDDKIFNMMLIAVFSGILGGKLLFIITEIKNISKNSSIFKNLSAGFVVYGAIIGGILSVYLYCKKQKWNVLKVFDLVVPSLAIGQAFGRIGCFLAGCCYGKHTDCPIGVVFHESSYAPNDVLLYPTQIMSSIFDFFMVLILLWYDNRRGKVNNKNKDGRTFALYLIMYSIGRSIIEVFRGDKERGFIGIFSTSQFISLFVIIVGIAIFNIHRIRKNSEE